MALHGIRRKEWREEQVEDDDSFFCLGTEVPRRSAEIDRPTDRG